MFALVTAFFEITVHRRGPEDIPASRFLLSTVLVVDVVAGLLLLLISPDPTDLLPTILFMGIVVAFTLSFIWLVVSYAGKASRFLQTATAVFGANAILSFVALPIVALLGPGDPTEWPPLPTLLFFIILLWQIDIFAFILSRSLQISYVMALLLVVAYQFFTLLMRDVLMLATP